MTRRDLILAPAIALAAQTPAQPMAGTQPLTWDGDLSERMMDGAHQFVERQISQSITRRKQYWRRDASSNEAYEKSIHANRARFLKQIGVVDARVASSCERFGDDANPALIADQPAYNIYQVRWPVLEGVTGEGLLLSPKRTAFASVVALADAVNSPEQLAGLALGVPAAGQWARRLAENGIAVVIPTTIDRTSRWSGHPDIQVTDQTHREWIYRQAFHMGRHIIGYEVQKVLAAVDWLVRTRAAGTKIGVAGYCEGGLVAFYAAAADARIDAAFISGYFDSRQVVWAEPIYRNVWGLLHEFGDAEIATLVAPRALVFEYSRPIDITNQKGDVRTPAFASVKAEFDRIATLLPNGFQRRELISANGQPPASPGSQAAIEAFAHCLGVDRKLPISDQIPQDLRTTFDPSDRMRRQVRELETHVQSLIRGSERVREEAFLYKAMPELADNTWSSNLRSNGHAAAKFIEAAKPYRRYFREEVLGTFNEPLLAPNPRTRRIYDKEKWTGYEVVLDVWRELFAWGVLLLPKDIKPGERRPVVVCQHGRRGIPQDVIEGDNAYYHDFAARLAERGFITFAPHNLYRGEDRYRWLSRKANGVKGSLFSFIVSQHEQILRWLKTLPMVDPARIAFYGLSYGGESAVRIPTVLEDYSLSICSGDFNSWTEKVASTDQRFSFMYSIEWEMPYFNMGSTFDYAEMTYLMLPRPFMVERGHNDRVARDQWVAREYAKVRWLYTQLGLGDKTEIEYFNGGHTINGEGTFRFLHKHLKWPG